MQRTLFTMGFNSPSKGYGTVRPGMGISMDDVKDFFKATSKPAPAPVVPAAPPVPQTIFGIDQNTVMIGGAVLLGLGLLIAIVAGRKASPKTAPARR